MPLNIKKNIYETQYTYTVLDCVCARARANVQNDVLCRTCVDRARNYVYTLLPQLLLAPIRSGPVGKPGMCSIRMMPLVVDSIVLKIALLAVVTDNVTHIFIIATE